jgi:hypothetical protein
MSITLPSFNLAASLAQLAQTASRPNFELQFNIAQNAALDRFNEKVKEFQDSNFGAGKVALFQIKAARLERSLDTAKDYKATVENRRLVVKEALDELSALRDLADSTTLTEFEDKRSELLATLGKLTTLNTSGLGAPDSLGDIKPDSIAAIEGIVTNSFATPADVTTAQATIDSVTSELSDALTIIEINKDAASSLIDSTDRGLTEARDKIDDIIVAERKKQIDEIQALEQQTATILTSISLAFEGSQFITQFVDQNTIQPREIDPGSVLNLFA